MADLCLRAWRAHRAFSQADLAERSGITKATIVKLEKPGHPTPHPRTIRKLAEALGIEPHRLYESPSPKEGAQ